ncbi:MAG: GNAT family N-acetyltransferase [Parafilimonas sp.]
MQLQLLRSHEIDKQKWNDCLKNSINPFIYASSVYLDCMADNWDGIIGGDYDIIMPIPWRKKFGIKYTYHVPFIQQLGVFGKKFQQDDVRDCIRLMLQNFKYGDYSLNFMNKVKHGKQSNNYMLSLASNYKSTSFFYADKLKADLTKATNNSFEYKTATADEVITLFKELYTERLPDLNANNYKKLHNLCAEKHKENNLVTRKIIVADKPVAMGLLLKDKFRIYNLISCTTPEGRVLHAGHFLYDSLMKEFSQTGLIFDFEGSDIPGVEHFFKSFGAINQPYTKIHFNHLPYFLRLLKR